MQVIEIGGTVNAKGEIRLDKPLNVKNQRVKVILLFHEDEEDMKESQWLKNINANPAFDCLKDEEEDIYTITDGEPVNNEV